MKNESIVLFKQVRELILSSRRIAVRGINTLLVLTNFEIGRLIVEHEQSGKKRAGYGQKLIARLSKQLTSEFGHGFSKRNLEYMRRFFIEYRERITKITLRVSGELAGRARKSQIVSGELSAKQPESRLTYNWDYHVQDEE